MGVFVDIKNWAKNSGIFVISVLLFFYFGFYVLYGDRGLRKYVHLNKEVEHARGLLAQYHNQKEDLSNQVRLISSESLDLDMLEERVRVVLNYAGDNEFVILDESGS